MREMFPYPREVGCVLPVKEGMRDGDAISFEEKESCGKFLKNESLKKNFMRGRG